MSILEKIVYHKKNEILDQKLKNPLARFQKMLKKSDRDFKKSISKPGLNIIAEIKKASPSNGVLRKDFSPIQIAKIYEKYAQAISVLTDEEFFQGKLEYLTEVRNVTTIPILQKDFVIDEYQIYQSRLYEADAILLIAAILTKSQIDRFLKIAQSLDIDCLVEVHNEEELKKVLKTNAQIIGINNRDLNTLKVDLNTTLNLCKIIPEDKIIVSESGIKNPHDLTLLKDKVDAVLIGACFMKAHDVEICVKEFLFTSETSGLL